MTCLRTLAASSMALFTVTLLAGNAVAQEKTLKDQLVGTWALVSWEQTRPDGSKFQSFGPNPKGMQVFDAGGHFFLMFARPDLPKIAASNRNQATLEEARAIMIGSIAYFGTYSIDDGSKTVVLRIEASTFPNQLGRQQKRLIRALTNNELKYTNPASTSGGQVEVALRRVK